MILLVGLARIRGISLVSSGDPVIHMWIEGYHIHFLSSSYSCIEKSYDGYTFTPGGLPHLTHPEC